MVPNLSPPVPGKPYLVSESVGAIEGVYVFRRAIGQPDQQDQARLHALAHSQAHDPTRTYCGLLGWCAFDYASLAEPGWDGLKTPGVADTFRIPKPGQPCTSPRSTRTCGPSSSQLSTGTSAPPTR